MYTKARQWAVSYRIGGRWLCDECVLGKDFMHACKMAAYIAGTVARQHGRDPVSETVTWEVHGDDTAMCGVNSGSVTVNLKGGA